MFPNSNVGIFGILQEVKKQKTLQKIMRGFLAGELSVMIKKAR